MSPSVVVRLSFCLLLAACGVDPDQREDGRADAGLLSDISDASSSVMPAVDGGLAIPDASLSTPDGGAFPDETSELTTLAEFRGEVTADGAMQLTLLTGDAVTDAGLRRAQQGLCTLSIVQDGVAGSGPANSLELVTGSTGLDADCEGYLASPLFCGAVTVRSFYTSPQSQVFAQIQSLVPSTGFGVQNGDVVPGASSGLGSWAYGDLGAASSAPANAGVRNWVFARSGGNFTFTGRVVANVTELCDGLDNDCDGATDEGLGCRTQGQSCAATVDCGADLVCTASVCSPAGCPSGEHLDAGACVSDTRPCSITNGTGSQSYAAGSWSACGIVSCSNGYHEEAGTCANDVRTCSPLPSNATAATETWAGAAYGTCTISACLPTHHLEDGACLSNTGSCSVLNGTGSRTYNAGAWSSCTLTGCNAGYHVQSGACELDTRSCTLADGTGNQSWLGSAWSDCTPTSCDTGYHVESGACASDARNCLLTGGAGNQTWNGSSWNSCVASACYGAFSLYGGTCVPAGCGNSVVEAGEACDDGNLVATDGCTASCAVAACGDGLVQAGIEGCDDGNTLTEECNYGAASCTVCNATCTSAAGETDICGDGILDAAEVCDDGNTVDDDSCANSCLCGTGYHVESGACLSNTRSCSSSNATIAFESWTGSAYGACTATACDANYHLEGGACLSNTRACSVANATTATQSWTGNDYTVCAATGCAAGYSLTSGACVAAGCGNSVVEAGEACDDGNTVATDGCTSTCTVAACGDGVVQAGVDGCDDGNTVTEECAYGEASCAVCTATCATAAGETDICGDGLLDTVEVCDDGNSVNGDSCSNGCVCGTGFHLEGGACTSDTRSCLLANGTGTEQWNGSSYGSTCSVATCNNGYHIAANSCEADVVSCTLANATAATQTWSSGTSSYGACTASACDATYHVESGACAANVRVCTLANGTATETWNSATSSYGSCTPGVCNSGYHVESGACLSNSRDCTLPNATVATESWTGSGYGSCTATICASGYHVESGACVSDTRSCSPLPANATAGTQTWTGSAYGACTATACASGYHVESGACVSDTRSCSPLPANATAGTQTWAGSAYGACTVTACASGYILSAGACVLQPTVGASCTSNAECATGFCATGPDGTANDRCAPTGMNYIPAGTFSMGSPLTEVGRSTDEGQHTVTLSRSFFLGQTEVTQGQWKALSGGINPSYFQSPTGPYPSTANANDSGAVDRVRWYAAVAFANARSAAEGLTSCYTLTGCTDAADGWKDGNHSGCTGATFAGLTCTGYRLPTESEWEYAARAGTTTATYGGNLSATSGCVTLSGTGGFAAGTGLASLAWYNCNASGRSQATASKAPNAFGLFDMLGYVNEWTGDRYVATSPGTVTDPLGAATGSTLVVKGGAYNNGPVSARAAWRGDNGESVANEDKGFRLARTVTRSCASLPANATAAVEAATAAGWACEATACAASYILDSGACYSDPRSCSPMPANTTAGTQAWTGSAFGSCTASACSASYHVEGGVCLSDTRSCSTLPANTTAGTQTWNSGTSSYGSCVATTCSAFYHVEGGACVSDTRSCTPLPANATASRQTWNSGTSSYGSCAASACASGYGVNMGVCSLGSSIGAACTANAECATGFCATGPDGTANDRCAPTSMNYIPAGTFAMGSLSGEVGRETDESRHNVTLSRAFFMGQTEVTQGQWKALSGGTNPSFFQSTTGTVQTTSNANDSGPAENLDWYAAVAFANARSAAEGLTSCYALTGCTDEANGWQDGIHDGCTGATFAGLTCTGYRLPTESEWEYAARAGTTTATYGGNLSGTVTNCTTAQANLAGIAWWCNTSGNRTNAVGGKTSNAFGLSDMLGNVWEWTGDWYGTYPGTVTDPLGTATGTYRVFRGGSWSGFAQGVRAARRGSVSTPVTRANNTGFRLSRTVPAALGTACTANADCASGFCATGPDGTANDRCAPTGMNYIPAGTFTMGSPSTEVGRFTDETQHSVTISRSFFIGQTEVTQGQWKALSGGINPSFHQNTTCTYLAGCASTENANDSGPVEYLDWYAAVAFANARSAAEGLTSCYTLTGCTDAANGWKDGIHSSCTGATFAGLTCTGYRLPTESEWEYAARGGTTTATYGGNLSATSGCVTLSGTGGFAAGTALASLAWDNCNAASRTQAVGGKTANSFGLSDMLGNVWEWTGDWYGNYPAGSVTDPLGAGAGSSSRVIRGGSWFNNARNARAAYRDFGAPDNRYSSLGFRLSRTAP